MNTSENRRALNMSRFRAPFFSTIQKIISLYEYQGTRNHAETITLLRLFEEKICDQVQEDNVENVRLIHRCIKGTVA